ncbi:hypothetical protein GRF29_1g863994 [Pseudopithomyces chartarum]|uniref:Uncharacterized protein n=1 Tax=Pseudopithomyces chartarum TaxID=1892770 RepID=A0AAN6M9B7_9PLEO|nr:hypothetical protein GRF29_1g863994 [Pseudopithomyces chartarum]
MRQPAIVATSLVLGLLLLATMVVVARFLWPHSRQSNHQEPSVDPATQPTSLLARARSVKLVPALKKDSGQRLPTLSAILKAGDEAVFSSALLNAHHGAAGELPLQHVYDAFANELRNRPLAERGALSPAAAGFLSSARKPQRIQSVSLSPPSRPDPAKRASRKSVDVIRNSIDLTDLGIGRSRSVKKAAPSLVTLLHPPPSASGDTGPIHSHWDNDLQQSLQLQGHTAITVTGHELAALSVVLGSPIEIIPNAQEKCESWANTYKGALGVSIAATAMGNGSYHIALTSNKRHVSQLPAKGSGYSTLHAKHHASGSLLFESDSKATHSILVTYETLEHLKSGTCLSLQPVGADTGGAQFLASLPNSRLPSFHAFTPSTTADQTSRLVHAIGDLVFTGGLTPFASIPLIQTVQFVASGGLVPGRLLQRLDALVEKVHRQAPHLQLFGPLLENSNTHLRFRVNERLARLATGTLTDEVLAEKVARMSRYVTLLERLMNLVPGQSPAQVSIAVREGLRSEMERSYAGAVAAQLIGGTIVSTPQSKRSKSVSRLGTRRSRHSSKSSGTASPDGMASTTSDRPSSTFPSHNLGRHVEGILKGSLPLDVQTIIMVARLVLVAWTLSVESVAWDQDEAGFKVMDPAQLPGKMYMW